MFSTCRGRAGVEDGSSCMSPLRRLKLTSRTMILLDDTNSSGRPPDSKLWDRLRRSSPVRLPSDGEMRPSSPSKANETSVTAPSTPQVIPFHVQQSVPFRSHDTARPPSRDSPARNCRREPFSCSVHELAGDATESRTSIITRAQPRKEHEEEEEEGLDFPWTTNERRFGSRVRGSAPVFCAPASGSSFLVHTIHHARFG